MGIKIEMKVIKATGMGDDIDCYKKNLTGVNKKNLVTYPK